MQLITQYEERREEMEGRKKVLTQRKRRERKRKEKAQAGMLSRVTIALVSDWLLMSVTIRTCTHQCLGHR